MAIGGELIDPATKSNPAADPPAIFLSDEELERLTHCRQPAAQARFLDRMNAPYRRRRDGTLLVGRLAMERAMLGSQPEVQQPAANGLKWKVNR